MLCVCEWRRERGIWKRKKEKPWNPKASTCTNKNENCESAHEKLLHKNSDNGLAKWKIAEHTKYLRSVFFSQLLLVLLFIVFLVLFVRFIAHSSAFVESTRKNTYKKEKKSTFAVMFARISILSNLLQSISFGSVFKIHSICSHRFEWATKSTSKPCKIANQRECERETLTTPKKNRIRRNVLHLFHL